MKISRLLLLSILFVALFMTACEEDDKKVNEAKVLVEYLESVGSPNMGDYASSLDMPSIIPAPDVYSLNATGDIYVIDIRTSTAYDAGHIPNAVNVSLANLLAHVEGINMGDYQKVAIVCVTGQTAGYATMLLRLMGYNKVYSMKWGMCSWHSDFSTNWETTIANGNSRAAEFVTTPAAKGAAGSLPELHTGKKTGQEILEARVNELFTLGYNDAKIDNGTVFSSLSSYYIVNYWSETHYNIGHIPGAIQYSPRASMKLAADLTTLPTDKPIVVYCYTGQTSSFMAAYLRLLGYNAKSLLYGTNAMIYDIMTTNEMTTFKESYIMDYTYDVTTK